MSIFKRKTSLKNRVKSLENFFGVFYAEDYGDYEHKLEADGYSVLHRLQKDVAELKGKAKK